MALRCHGLSGMRFIDDECFFADMSLRPISFLLDFCCVTPTLPGWFVPCKLWILISASDISRKLCSVVMGCLCVLCTYWLGRQIGGRRVGLLAALLLALSGYHIYFSQTATPYVFLSLLGAVAVWSLLVLLERGSRAAAAIHCLALAWACYSHQSAVLLWGAELAAVLLLALKGRRKHLGLFAVSQAITLILAAPAICLVIGQLLAYRHVTLHFVPEVSLAVVADTLHQMIAYRSELGWAHYLELLAAVAAVTVGAHAVIRTVRAGAEEHWPLVILCCVAILPFVACILAGIFIAKDLFYAPRFFATFVPAGAALLAAAISRVAGHPRAVAGGHLLARARVLLAGLLLAAALVPQAGSALFLFGSGRQAESFPIDGIATYLRQHGRPRDVAMVHNSWYKMFFDRYYHEPFPEVVGAVRSELRVEPFGGMMKRVTPADVQRELRRVRRYRRLFLILSKTDNELWRDPERLLERAMDRRFTLVDEVCFSCETGDPVLVKLYQLAPPPRGRR